MCGNLKPIPVEIGVRRIDGMTWPPFVEGLLCGLAAANDPLAVPFRDVDPGLLISVALRRAAARVVARRRAIVLAGLRDAVTFLGLEAGCRRGLLRRQQ